jgi:hypothetical protein
MKTKRISLHDIVIDDEVLVRTKIDEDHLENLIEALKQSTDLPPVVVFNDDGTLILADGYHRYEAAKKCKKNKIKAVVHKGSKRQAILFACGANSGHGLRRTNEDKLCAVTKLLTDSDWSKWSDGKIAKRCAVSQVFVSNVRKDLTHNGYEFSNVRTGLNNKTYKTSPKKTCKKTAKDDHDGGDDNNDDDIGDSQEDDHDGEEISEAKKQPLHTDKEISEVGAAIFNLNKKTVKLNKMIQKKKKWSKTRKAKVRTIKDAIDQNFITISNFLRKIID